MKVKSIMSAAVLCAGTLLASPSWAAEQLSDDQMDKVTAGYEFGPFQTTLLDIANPNYLDTFNVMNPYFAPGTPVIYMGPLTGPLFNSDIKVQTAPVTVPFTH
jgi:hypothetical protein